MGEERGVFSEVTVPSVAAEEARRLPREVERLKQERTGRRNQLPGLLVGPGVRLELKAAFLARVERVVLWNGPPLPTELQAAVQREWDRLPVVEQQLAARERQQQEGVATAPLGRPWQ